VLVAGGSGAGKTTVAAAISGVLGVPHVEIDALFHGPDWTPGPSSRPTWTPSRQERAWVDGVGSTATSARAARAGRPAVWLDVSRAGCCARWSGGPSSAACGGSSCGTATLEPPLWTIFGDPDHIVRWAWTTHGLAGPRVQQAQRTRPELPVVRLRSRSDVRRWLQGPLREAAEPPAHG
jgi:hypothetical protein